MTDAVIQVRNLTIGWGDRTLLERVSFEVRRGEVFVILGGSGSGKSTLLRHLIGLAEPHAGEITVLGQNPLAHHATGLGPPPFGVMFQSGALLGSLTVGENVGLGLSEWTQLPPDAIAAIVRAKLRLVGMEEAEDKMPAELSGGMKKRAAIARALALEPKLLFLDEPSAGLDPITSAELDALIQTLNGGLGVTVVMVTHELESVLTVGTRCILLDGAEKGIIAEGEPRRVRDETADPRVAAFFARRAARPELQAEAP